MNPRYPLVAERAAHHCEYCLAPEAVFNSPLEVEHIIPANRGGKDEDSNWALSCRSCNLHKSVHVEGIDPETEVTVTLFHPRQDRWSDHFRVEEANSEIVGQSSVGRATVARLKMNTPAQLNGRRQWARLRLFPPA